MEKRCPGCGETKPISAWHESQQARSGSWCKECFRAWHRKRYQPKHGTDDTPRPCTWCGVSYRPKTRRVSKYCSPACKEAERKETGQGREQHLRRKYGIGAADYDRILVKQGGGCALCGIRPEDLRAGKYRTHLHVDHCHDTGRVRGLLCPDHNLLLGRFGDDPVMFKRILRYLEG